MTILAAIDDSAAAQPVIAFASRLANLFAARVACIHVQEDDSGHTAAAIADAAHVPLHVRHGDVVTALRAEMHDRDAIALVIGTRGLPTGASPAGHVALDLVQSLEWPIVVVPPHAANRPLRRVLVAVEGDGESHALRGLFERLGARPTPEVIAFHATKPSELPPFADSPVHEAEAFEREFRAQVSSNVVTDPSRIRFEMRVGEPASALRDTADELDVDLVVMAWHRNLTGGHGRLVHEMLANASVPVALLPLEAHPDKPPQHAQRTPA